eukprot:g969.t1
MDVPEAVAGVEAQEVQQSIVSSIQAIKPDGVGPFSQQCMAYGQCGPNETAAKAKEFHDFLVNTWSTFVQVVLLQDSQEVLAPLPLFSEQHASDVGTAYERSKEAKVTGATEITFATEHVPAATEITGDISSHTEITFTTEHVPAVTNITCDTTGATEISVATAHVPAVTEITVTGDISSHTDITFTANITAATEITVTNGDVPAAAKTTATDDISSRTEISFTHVSVGASLCASPINTDIMGTAATINTSITGTMTHANATVQLPSDHNFSSATSTLSTSPCASGPFNIVKAYSDMVGAIDRDGAGVNESWAPDLSAHEDMVQEFAAEQRPVLLKLHGGADTAIKGTADCTIITGTITHANATEPPSDRGLSSATARPRPSTSMSTSAAASASFIVTLYCDIFGADVHESASVGNTVITGAGNSHATDTGGRTRTSTLTGTSRVRTSRSAGIGIAKSMHVSGTADITRSNTKVARAKSPHQGLFLLLPFGSLSRMMFGAMAAEDGHRVQAQANTAVDTGQLASMAVAQSAVKPNHELLERRQLGADDAGRRWLTGGTWTEDTSVGAVKNWQSITMSADGTKQAAVVGGLGQHSGFDGNIWTSADSGGTWTEDTSVGATKSWYSITMSADGTKQAAVVSGGNIWTSADSGGTWTEDTSIGTTKDWTSITMSADGTKQA